jgi:hypothetical protein
VPPTRPEDDPLDCGAGAGTIVQIVSRGRTLTSLLALDRAKTAPSQAFSFNRYPCFLHARSREKRAGSAPGRQLSRGQISTQIQGMNLQEEREWLASQELKDPFLAAHTGNGRPAKHSRGCTPQMSADVDWPHPRSRMKGKAVRHCHPHRQRGFYPYIPLNRPECRFLSLR